jgi:hypothetical protein
VAADERCERIEICGNFAPRAVWSYRHRADVL